MEGTVYVLTNPAMPDLVKIGKTTRDVQLRLADLYTTGVPYPFECEYAAKVTDLDKTEKAFHIAFKDKRVNHKREFFKIDPIQAIAVLELMAIEDMTPVVQKEADNVDIEVKASVEKFKKDRLPVVNYFEMGLKVGDVFTYEFDQNITCKVKDNRKVEYEGEDYYLTGLTKKLMDTDKAIRGSKYWYCKGKNIVDIYNKTYIKD